MSVQVEFDKEDGAIDSRSTLQHREHTGVRLDDRRNWGGRPSSRALDTTNARIAIHNKNISTLEDLEESSKCQDEKVKHRLAIRRENRELGKLRKRRMSYDAFLPFDHSHQTFKVVSYNLLSSSTVHGDRARFNYAESRVLNWTHRRVNLLNEILSYEADVILLQGVDEYTEWWQPQLSSAGYDGVFRKKRKSNNGLAIFYRRDEFQLFSSDVVQFSDLVGEKVPPVFAEDEDRVLNLANDDMALIAALQPWEKSQKPSALCVVCAELCEDATRPELRYLQARRLCERVETFNMRLQLPCVVGGSFYSPPTSDLYKMITTGCTPKHDEPPRRMAQPIISDVTTASVRVSWTPPSHAGDCPVLRYRLERRVDGNVVVGFGMREIIAPDKTSHIVTGLASGVSYDFRICAESDVGAGLWSPISVQVRTKTHNFFGKPRDDKVGPLDVRPTSSRRTRHRRTNMSSMVATSSFSSSDSMASARSGRSTVRPLSRRRLGTTAATMTILSDSKMHLLEGDDIVQHGSGLTPRFQDGSLHPTTTPIRLRELGNVLGKSVVRGVRYDRLVHCLSLRSAYSLYPDETSGVASELAYTCREEGRVGVEDYIFFTCERLTPVELVGLPSSEKIRAVDPRQPKLTRDTTATRPDDWVTEKYIIVPNYETGLHDEIENPDYVGEWEPPVIQNPHRYHRLLPNKEFSSSHLALVCAFEFTDPNLASIWH